MTTPTPSLALGLCLLGLVAAGCDSDTSSPADYRIVAHADIGALKAAPWIADAMKGDKIDLSGDLGACAPLVLDATAVTLGVNEDAFEVYVEGKFTAKQATACADHVATTLVKKGAKADEKVETAQLGDGLFAVYRGAFKPSRTRLKGLVAADPTPAGKQALWVVAHDDANKGEVEHVEAWATAGKGLDAHVEVHFDSAKAAAEIYGQAAMGLAALRLSDDMGDLAKAISVSSGGDTVTAEIHASNDLVRKLMAESRVKGKVDASSRDDEHGSSFSVELEAK